MMRSTTGPTRFGHIDRRWFPAVYTYLPPDNANKVLAASSEEDVASTLLAFSLKNR
jgi:hypothetical protein